MKILLENAIEWFLYGWSYYTIALDWGWWYISWLLIGAAGAALFIAFIFALGQEKFWKYLWQAIWRIFPGLFSTILNFIPVTLGLFITNFVNCFGKQERRRSYQLEWAKLSSINTWNSKVVGPILKAAIWIFIAVRLVILSICAIPISMIVAIPVGFHVGVMRKEGMSIFKQAWEIVEWYDKLFADYLDNGPAKYVSPELKEGERKYDIHPWYLVGGLVSFAFSLVIAVPYLVAVIIYHLFPLKLAFFRHVLYNDAIERYRGLIILAGYVIATGLTYSLMVVVAIYSPFISLIYVLAVGFLGYVIGAFKAIDVSADALNFIRQGLSRMSDIREESPDQPKSFKRVEKKMEAFFDRIERVKEEHKQRVEDKAQAFKAKKAKV